MGCKPPLALPVQAKGKKKKSSKSEKSDKKKPSKADRAAELERAVFSQPVQASTNWADEEEDDFGADDLGPLPEGWQTVRAAGRP